MYVGGVVLSNAHRIRAGWAWGQQKGHHTLHVSMKCLVKILSLKQTLKRRLIVMNLFPPRKRGKIKEVKELGNPSSVT